MSAVLTKSEIDEFQRDGFVVLKGAFSRTDAVAMEDAWWRELFETYGICRDDRSTWFQPARDLREGKVSPMQMKIQTGRVKGAIDDLMGEGAWSWPKTWGRAIATFPQGGAWEVPTGWHWDSPVAWHRDGIASVFAFTFVGAVAPGGGGTAVLAGSHRLLRHWEGDMAGKDARAQREWLYRAHPWLAAVAGVNARARPMLEDGVAIDGIALRVVELCGAPGDMVLCHPTIVHSASANCATWPRFMRIGMVGGERLARRLKGG